MKTHPEGKILSPVSAALRGKVHNPPFLGLITSVTLAYLLFYLWWRANYSLNPDAPFFSWALLVAEAFGVLNYMLFVWITRNVAPAREHKAPPPGLSVDVFIPTFNEDFEVLEATVTGALKISYPHITYVLDDGNRPEVKALTDRLGAEYISREMNTNHKAGNINHALGVTSGEFIVILDADMVPQPDFIDRTLGYFEDEKLAFVQTPQEFYNQDSIQHDRKKKAWHEQSLFFRVIQPGKNYTNSAFWTGSPSIMRRAALDSIGGVATNTVTEDIHTSVRLHSKGWHSLFLNEVLAYGIAPQTIHAFLLQRLRWAQGTMQLYRSKESPFWRRGLMPAQRLSYVASFLAYAESIQKILLIVTPTVIILFEVFPMSVNGLLFAALWFPYFAFTVLANRISGRGYFNYFQTEKFNLLKTVTFLQSFLTLFWHKGLAFKVTPKSVDGGVRRKERGALRVYMALFGAIIGVTFAGIMRLLNGLSTAVDPSHYAVAIVWATFNAGIILLGIRDVLSHKHDRKHYRFPFRNAAQIFNSESKSMTTVNIKDISLRGVGFVVAARDELPTGSLTLYFETPTHEYVVLPLENVKLHRNFWGRKRAGATFGEMAPPDRRRLFELLYVTIPGHLPNRGYEPGVVESSAVDVEDVIAMLSRRTRLLARPADAFSLANEAPQEISYT
jgi:cellulose synthase (UDP-forming)